MKELDEMILNASDTQLKKFQELDICTQLKGSNFYDVFLKYDKKSKLNPKAPSIKKK
jgi:hypothetical protein